MILEDLLKRVDVENEETRQKFLMLRDNDGWSNIKFLKETDNTIELAFDCNSPFSDDN